MRKDRIKSSPREEAAELAALADLPDDAIDTSDAPELADWPKARRGLFYRPVKQPLTLRLDAELIAWLRANATPDERYQTRSNRVCELM
jgi:uncharacterized protein (DUF4415 family)